MGGGNSGGVWPGNIRGVAPRGTALPSTEFSPSVTLGMGSYVGIHDPTIITLVDRDSTR